MVLVLSGIFGCIFWFFSYGQWTFTLAPWLAFPLLCLLFQHLKKNAGRKSLPHKVISL